MCDNYPVIPQFNNTCWFNVIITACCYSENLKKLMISKSKDWDKSNSFFKYLKTILKYSYSTDSKIKKMFIKEKIDYLLFKYLNFFDKNSMNIMRTMIHYRYNDISILAYYDLNYIITFFKKINISCLDVIILDNNKYLVDFYKNFNLNFEKRKMNREMYSFTMESHIEVSHVKFEINKKLKKPNYKNKIPEVIVILPNTLSLLNFDIPDVDLYKYTSKDFKNNFKNNFTNNNSNDYIEYKGYKYKLDACLLANYNKIGGMKHAILGITCNNKRYIYNSLNETNKIKNPCGFYNYDWNINKDDEFYFDYNNCKIKKVNKKNKMVDNELVYSFNKGPRTFIYVKVNNEDSEDNHNKFNSEDNSYRIISKKKEMKKSFYDIKNIELRYLKPILGNLGYSDDDLREKTKEGLLKLLEKKINVI